MVKKELNNLEDQEIDLVQVFKKIGNFFEGINTGIFRCIQFFIKNAVTVSILLLIGFGVGFYFDTANKKFDNKIIVIPNFESTNYLYSKINLISTKIKEEDYEFLKEVVGIKEPKKLLKIEITPIADVYKFVQNKTENFELLKLIAESGDINEIIEEDITSKNYPFHTILFSTDATTSDSETIQPLLKYLNDSKYYSEVQKAHVGNIQEKMIQNDSIIAQINGVLNAFSNTLKGTQKSSNLIYYNENTQLNDVIKTKEALINQQGTQKLELVNCDKIVKDISTTTNSRNKRGINGKLKVVLPAVFLLLFIVFRLFKGYYISQLLKAKAN